MSIGYIQFSAWYWEAVGNVTSSDIEPLNGSVELPHWDGAVSAHPNYNLTFLLLSDTQAEDKQVFSIRLTDTSSLTEVDSTANSVTSVSELMTILTACSV